MSKYAKAPTAIDTHSLPKNGDAGPEVVNTSGQASPNTQPVGRSGPTTPDLGGGNGSARKGHTMIGGETGQALADSMGRSLSIAAQRRAQIRQAVEQSEDPAGYLSYIFGLGRGRA